jgi:hypothetical protein
VALGFDSQTHGHPATILSREPKSFKMRLHA